MSLTAPHIGTNRLSLIGHTRGDFADCYAMWSNPEVTRFIGGKPSHALAPSLRVAEKCGYREYARGELHGGPIVLLERV